MTFEPPAQPDRPSGSGPAQPPQPPQPPVPPPAPAGRQWPGPPPPAQPGPAAPSELGRVNPMDWGILVAGFLALIFSFFDYYTAKATALGFSTSASESAWHGFFGWFAAIVALAAAALLALHLFMPSMKTPFPLRLTALAGFVLAAVFVIIAAFVTPGARSSAELSREAGVAVKLDYGRGEGYWLSLVAILAGAVVSFLRQRETGGRLPWERRKA